MCPEALLCVHLSYQGATQARCFPLPGEQSAQSIAPFPAVRKPFPLATVLFRC